MCELLIVVFLVTLATSVRSQVVPNGFVRIDGLFDNSFVDSSVIGDIPVAPGPKQATFSTPFRFYDVASTTIQIFENGYLFMNYDNTLLNAPNQFNPTQILNSNNDGDLYIIAPLMTRANMNHNVVHRTRSCTDITGEEYSRRDCVRASSEISRIKQENPSTPSVVVEEVMVITWELYGQDYVQAVLISGQEGGSAVYYVLFVYDFIYQLTGGNQEPLIAVRGGTTVVGIDFFKEDMSSDLNFLNFDATVLQQNTLTATLCGRPGVMVLQPSDFAPNVLTTETLSAPKDTCSEHALCYVDEQTGLWVIELYLLYNTGALLVAVNQSTTYPEIVATCPQLQIGGDNIARLEITPSPIDDNEPTCGFYVGSDGTVIGQFYLLKDIRFIQDGDFHGTFQCNVFDFPNSVEATLSIGDVAKTTIPPTTRSIDLYAVDSSGTGANVVTSCTLGDPIFLELKYTRDVLDNTLVSPYGVYGYSCTFTNYDPSIPLAQQMDANGYLTASDTGIKILPIDIPAITDSCISGAPDAAFTLTPHPDAVGQTDGFVKISGSFVQGQLEWVMQTGAFPCAGFLGTQLVYAVCDVDFCFNSASPSQECENSCQAQVSGRRKRSIEGDKNVTTVRTSWRVISPDESATEANTCMDQATAIVTVSVLVISLVLATGLTLGAFLKTLLRHGSKGCCVD